MTRLFLAVWLVLPLFAQAEDTTTQAQVNSTSSTVTTTMTSTDNSRWYGFAEFRPSFTSKVGEWHTENTAEAGYYFNKTDRLYYTQWINSNIFNPTDSSKKGLDVFADDGVLRTKIGIYDNNGFSVSYQGRLHTPTRRSKRDAGFLTTFRNFIKVAQRFNSTVSLDFSAAPTLHLYDRAGYQTNAHPIYGVLASVNVDINFTEKLYMAFPVVYDGNQYRAFDGAPKLNDRWGSVVFIWPEIDYDINSTHTVGISYYSDNLATDNLSELTLQKGLEGGVFQGVWAINL